MTRRIIYVVKAEFTQNYSIGEYVGDSKTWKVQEAFESSQELIDYLSESKDKYADELRRRKNLEIVINVPNEYGESLFKSLNNIKNKFRKICIRKSPSNNH